MMREALSSFEVRFAEKKDIPGIMEITREAFARYKETTGASRLEALEETAEDIGRDIENKLVLIAMSDGESVGCVRVELMSDGMAYLTRFAVRVTSQNNGIGKAMMNHVDKLMKKNGIKRISLYTASKATALMRFYYGRGFYVESTDTVRGYIRAKLVKDY